MGGEFLFMGFLTVAVVVSAAVLSWRVRMVSTLATFKNRFEVKPRLAWHLGVERERFITDKKGRIVPSAKEIIDYIRKQYLGSVNFLSGDVAPGLGELITYELSACQLESRTIPDTLKHLKGQLERWDKDMAAAFEHLGYVQSHIEVAPEDMPLDVYPDPTGRYQKIVSAISRTALLAACRVAGTHIHVGMPDLETALKVYNYLTRHVTELCEMGNGSFGQRLEIYRQMAPDWKPMPYESWQDYYDVACRKGFVDDPRQCWTLIRISVHGTIEFRMFGATDSIDRIVSWAERCHALCLEAMNTR